MVAEWVLARGGSVGVISSQSGQKDYSRLADLPVGPFVINVINLNSASGITPDEWKSLVHLRALGYLTLFNCSVDDAALASIGRLEMLRRLMVVNDPKPEDAARITDEGVRHLASLARLEFLEMQNTAITAQALEPIGKLTRLNALQLSANPKLVVDSLAALRGLTRIESLSLYSTPSQDTALANLSALPRLRSLHIGRTKLTDAGLSHLKGCRELRYLHLQGTSVTAAGVRKLADHTSLGVIVLRETNILPAELPALAEQFPRTMLVHPALKARYTPELDAYAWIKSVGGAMGKGSYADGLEPAGTAGAYVGVSFDKTFPAPQELRKLAELKFLVALHFRGDARSDANMRLALESLRDHPTLTQFGTGADTISSATMRELTRHSALSDLQLDGAGKPQTNADAFTVLPSLPRLRSLLLDTKLATDEVWKHLAQLGELRVLRISGSQLTGQGLGELRAIPELYKLWLTGLQLVPADLAPLAEFPELFHLVLDKSTLDDAGLANLAGCRTLRIVEARGTKVTAAGVAKLQQALPKCTVFWDAPASSIPTLEKK